MLRGNGAGQVPTDGRMVVHEYLKRKALSEIGMTSDLGTLPAWKVNAFYAISQRVSEHQESERKKSKVKRGR